MHSSFYSTHSWIKTALGSDIALSASASLKELESTRPIILMGGIHGDEPEGVELALQTQRWLQRAAQAKRSLAPWLVIPCLNVDGFARKQRVNGRGVDLNRNYPSVDWSEKFEKERYFPGRSPASEMEIQGVVELITCLQPRLLIHCHSWEPCIVATGTPGLTDARRLAISSGYQAIDDIGYPTPGSLSRYGWHDHLIPVICIEERDGLTDLSTVWPRFKKGIEEIFTDLGLRDE